MNQEYMHIVTDDSGKLIFDASGTVCLRDMNGTMHFVSLDLLPPNFLHDHNACLPTSVPENERARFGHNASLPNASHSSMPQNESAGLGHNASLADTRHTSMPQIERAGFGQNAPLLDASHTSMPQNESAGLETSSCRANWSRPRILTLIEAYKAHREIFRSTSIKNSEAWRRVAVDVPGFNPKQCEAKFKYIKSLYTKRKDNMGSTSSGAPAIIFDYFEEFDEIFHQEPNITPVATASSSSIAEAVSLAGTAPASEAAVTDAIGSPMNLETNTSARAPKRKRTRLEIQLVKFQKNMELREQAQEQRLNKFLSQQEACTIRICDMMQKFIDKL